MPHGPMKPAAVKHEMDACQLGRDRGQGFRILIETSFPMVAGIVMALAEEVNPPAPTVSPAVGFAKSNLNAASERRLTLARLVGASNSFAMSWELF